MNALDILYTPLDLPPCPEVDIDRLREWINRTYPQKELIDSTSGQIQAHNAKGSSYPWNFTFAKFFGWQNNFNIEFPEIANYATEIFGIADEELEGLALLPIRDNYIGTGFWHTDPDTLGLRFYIYNESYKTNKILMKTIDPSIPVKEVHGKLFDDHDPRLINGQVHVAEVINPRQPFYLNNMKAAHAIQNTVVAERIAVLFGTISDFNKMSNLPLTKKMNDLVVRSAYKYKEAIFKDDWSSSIRQQN
jgi:hypothetical protein